MEWWEARPQEPKSGRNAVRTWSSARLGETGEFYETEHIVEERQRRKGCSYWGWEWHGKSYSAFVCR
jgi:hypothetical protein